MTTPNSCSNCHEEIDLLDRPNIFQKLWNAYFLCDDCGRMMRITAIVTAVIMTVVGWFY